MKSANITDVTGIGPSSAALLSENGISTVEDLARASVAELVQIRGFLASRANRLIIAATEFLETKQPTDRIAPPPAKGADNPEPGVKAETATQRQVAAERKKRKKNKKKRKKHKSGKKPEKKDKKKKKGKRGGKKKGGSKTRKRKGKRKKK